MQRKAPNYHLFLLYNNFMIMEQLIMGTNLFLNLYQCLFIAYFSYFQVSIFIKFFLNMHFDSFSLYFFILM
jgi:uncharacterized phage infection (PIP) family protein YhgE